MPGMDFGQAGEGFQGPWGRTAPGLHAAGECLRQGSETPPCARAGEPTLRWGRGMPRFSCPPVMLGNQQSQSTRGHPASPALHLEEGHSIPQGIPARAKESARDRSNNG